MSAYIKYANRCSLTGEILYNEYGKCSLKFEGKDALKIFAEEGGKHVVQRVPPTEKRGRRQTSIVTVAVLPLRKNVETALNMKDVIIETKIGSGPGGQARNKTESCVVAKHTLTGLSVKIDSRDQHSNKKLALRILSERLSAKTAAAGAEISANEKRRQVGNGGRADKIRTYNFIDSRAVDHRSGVKTSRVDDVIYKGRFDLLIADQKE